MGTIAIRMLINTLCYLTPVIGSLWISALALGWLERRRVPATETRCDAAPDAPGAAGQLSLPLPESSRRVRASRPPSSHTV